MPKNPRARSVFVVAIIAVLALAGCSLPAGVDGNLTDDWAAVSAPSQPVPVVGGCYDSFVPDLVDNPALPCTQSHSVEVVHVGTFTGATAARLTPPPAGSALMKAAYASCQKPVTAFLGGEWHGALVQSDVVVPDASGWTGGARWYLCVLSRIFAVDDRNPTHSDTSLKGALAHPSADAIHCVRWNDVNSSVNDVTLTGCSAWFNGEYAGIYTAPNETWPTDKKKRETLALDGCEGVVAHYLGFSGSTDESDWVGYLAFYFDQERWDLGDRSVRCFTYRSKGGRFVATAKGLRGAKPKG